MKEHRFAEIYKVRDNLWAIDEIRKTTMYVYEGKDRVLLLDTGFGLLDLKELVGELCPGKAEKAMAPHSSTLA